MSDLLRQLDDIRIENGISQNDIAIALGVTPVSVSNWIRGKKGISYYNLHNYVDYLGCELIVKSTNYRTLDELKSDMCDNYCMYPKTCKNDIELGKYCIGCPLNKIYEVNMLKLTYEHENGYSLTLYGKSSMSIKYNGKEVFHTGRRNPNMTEEKCIELLEGAPEFFKNE